MLEQSKRSNDGFYYESTRNKVIVNGIICKLHKFRRLQTINGPKVEFLAGKNKQRFERDETVFYRTSGSNLSLCIYYYANAQKLTSTLYNRNLSYRFLRRFYPEELL